ncbi:MAG: lysophospholipase L1-like esterase [Planctomycetota bacterium]|jgi:lysophospholipase L1-like esterase
MSRVYTRVALILAGLLLALVSAEIGARIIQAQAEAARFDAERMSAHRKLPRGPVGLGEIICVSETPDLIFELRPGLRQVSYAGALISTNQDGFRSNAPTPVKSDKSYRVLGLGDSVMFGQGVPDGREYLARLERNLKADDPSREWQVINSAVPGYNSAQELAFLQSRGLDLMPDLVVIGFVSNDVNLPSFLFDSIDPWDLHRSFLLDWLRKRKRKHSASLLTAAPTQANHVFRVEEDPEKIAPKWRHLLGFDAVERAFDKLAELSAQHGFEVLLFSHRKSEHSERALEAARSRNFYTCDLSPRLEKYMREHDITRYRGSSLTISESDPHPSAIHHRIAADGLQRALERLEIAKPASEKQK